jgi:hypothetical protein
MFIVLTPGIAVMKAFVKVGASSRPQSWTIVWSVKTWRLEVQIEPTFISLAKTAMGMSKEFQIA